MGLDVLKGMINILKNCNPIVCIELLEQIEKTEQINFMNEIGYEFFANVKRGKRIEVVSFSDMSQRDIRNSPAEFYKKGPNTDIGEHQCADQQIEH